eukprot:2552520-Amphidinium_carterae.1
MTTLLRFWCGASHATVAADVVSAANHAAPSAIHLLQCYGSQAGGLNIGGARCFVPSTPGHARRRGALEQ